MDALWVRPAPCVLPCPALQTERVLFHYNGHGVPRPTTNGELWVFNSRYTQYIPLSVYELHTWLQTPSIYVLDCSAAGLIVNAFRSFVDVRAAGAPAQPVGGLARNHARAAEARRCQL